MQSAVTPVMVICNQQPTALFLLCHQFCECIVVFNYPATPANKSCFLCYGNCYLIDVPEYWKNCMGNTKIAVDQNLG